MRCSARRRRTRHVEQSPACKDPHTPSKSSPTTRSGPSQRTSVCSNKFNCNNSDLPGAPIQRTVDINFTGLPLIYWLSHITRQPESRTYVRHIGLFIRKLLHAPGVSRG